MIRAPWDWYRARKEDTEAGYVSGLNGENRPRTINGTGYEYGGYLVGKERFEFRKSLIDSLKPKEVEPFKYEPPKIEIFPLRKPY